MNTSQTPVPSVSPAPAQPAPAPGPAVRYCLKCRQPIQPGDRYHRVPAVADYVDGFGPGWVAFIHHDCPARG